MTLREVVSTIGMIVSAVSLHANVGTLDHVPPSLRFCGDEGRGFLGCPQQGHEALAGETLAVLRGREGLLRLGVEPVGDGARRLCGNEEAKPRAPLELRVPRLRRRRHI